LTELGVDRIVPFMAKRSVVQWEDEKSARNVARWRVIAREAVQQSRQAFLPEISEVRTVADLATAGGFWRADRGGEVLGETSCRAIAVGPEGGWDPSEREILFPAVALGSTVLRAETAALAAGVLLTLRS
jgi:16S rRNA (uracil1498-N3)-methyltransferase